jgi:hypothetical protein
MADPTFGTVDELSDLVGIEQFRSGDVGTRWYVVDVASPVPCLGHESRREHPRERREPCLLRRHLGQ